MANDPYLGPGNPNFNPNSSPYQLAGAIPFGNAGGGMVGAANDPNALGQQYSSAYNDTLKQNQALYQNQLSGYQQVLANQGNAQGAIQGGYNQLYNTVQDTIKGIGASQKQAIQDVYAQQSGAGTQQLINQGLGNSTVQGAMQRGYTLDSQKAQVALANQLAQLSAGYQSQIGGAGLNQANQANMQNTAEANKQLDFMNSVTAAYPNAQAYGDLLKQFGMFQQMDKNRQQVQQNQPLRGGSGMVASSGSPMPMGFGFQGGGGGGYAGGMASVTPFGMGSGLGSPSDQPWNSRNIVSPNFGGALGGGSFMNNALRAGGIGVDQSLSGGEVDPYGMGTPSMATVGSGGVNPWDRATWPAPSSQLSQGVFPSQAVDEYGF